MKRTIALIPWLFLCLLPGYGKAGDIPTGAAFDPVIQSYGVLSTYETAGDAPVHIRLGLGAGLRHDRLKWSIAGNLAGDHPNVLSELSWTKLYSYELKFDGEVTVGRFFLLRAETGYAWIDSGQVSDSDYDGDDRTLEYSRSISRTNGDTIWDASLGFGPMVRLIPNRVFWTPLFGYALAQLNLRITDGRQILASPPRTPPSGPLDQRLNSTYLAHWEGPWIGSDICWTIRGKHKKWAMELGGSLEYHFMVNYSGTGNWNLRSDLQHPVSFSHHAQGSGIEIQGRWIIHIRQRTSVRFGLSYLRWETSEGTNRTYPVYGDALTTRFNGAFWESTVFTGGLVYCF